MKAPIVKPVTEKAWQPQAMKPATRKQKAFIKHLIDNPKSSATDAAQVAYNVKSRHMAQVIASENMSKPVILTELAKHSGTSEFTLLEVMNYSKEYGRNDTKQGASYASTAAQIANSILDRLHGKATTKIEQTTQAVTLNIDLSGVIEPTTDKNTTSHNN